MSRRAHVASKRPIHASPADSATANGFPDRLHKSEHPRCLPTVTDTHLHPMKHCIALLAILCTCAALHAGAPVVEKVTSTSEKKSQLLSEGEDSFEYRCPGVGGYSVIFEGAHGRSWINLEYDSERTNLMDAILNACPGDFPSKADDTVQWRGTMQDGNFVPYACIVRMVSQVEGEAVENFVILQLAGAGSRVVGQVPASQGAKGAAALADKLCKFE